MSRRSERFAFRLTPDELEQFEMRADRAGVSKSEFVRQSIQTTDVHPPQSDTQSEALRTLSRKIAWIGNNLNQIARACNQHDPNKHSADILSVLIHIERQLQTLKDSYS
ncbi:MAG: plasmid mobilization relaxosome protein MobC [bacterium]